MDITFLINNYLWFEEKGILILPIIITLFIVHFLKLNLAIYSGIHKTFYIILTNIIVSIIGCLTFILFRNIFTLSFFLWASISTTCLSCGLVDIFDSIIKWIQSKVFITK
jgi:hypothetical protein